MIESPDFHDPALGIPVFSLYGAGAPAHARDDGHVRRAARRSAGRGLPHLHVHHDAALRASRRGAKHRKAVWILDRRIPRAGRSKGCDCARAGKASSARARCRCVTGSRLGELAHLVRAARSSSMSTIEVIPMEGLRPAERTPGYGWPLGERTWVEPEPERRQPLDGARVRRHRDDRRHHAVGGARHHPAARAVRRIRHRCRPRC